MRTVIVGDVHACRIELLGLLDRVGFQTGDRLVLVGDIVVRGPDPLGVLDVVRRTGAVVVRGNHEQKLLDGRAGRSSLPKAHEDVAAVLRPIDWALLEATPLSVDLPEHGVRVVHGGLDPRVPFEAQTAQTLLSIRAIDGELWAKRYQGPPHVVFGHNAPAGLQLHPWATGLDTGCVYGGKLTALVLARDEQVPRSLEARRAHLVSEPAVKMWSEPKGKPAES